MPVVIGVVLVLLTLGSLSGVTLWAPFEFFHRVAVHFAWPPQWIMLPAEEQLVILTCVLVATCGWIWKYLKCRWLGRKLHKISGDYYMVRKNRRNRKSRKPDQSVDNAIEEVLQDVVGELDVPDLRPRYLKKALEGTLEADIFEHGKAVLKAKAFAKLQSMFTSSNTNLVKSQKDLVREKTKLVESSYYLANRIQSLNQEKAESYMDHEIAMAEKELALLKWERKIDEFCQEDDVIEVQAIDEDQAMFDEIERLLGRQARREIFAQELVSKMVEELLRAKQKRIEEIEELEISDEDKEKMIRELERSVEFAKQRLYQQQRRG